MEYYMEYYTGWFFNWPLQPKELLIEIIRITRIDMLASIVDIDWNGQEWT